MDSQVSIKFSPNSYNHHYKLIYIDTTQTNKLFTAPKWPGNHYLMGVDLYGTDNSLV